MEALAAAPDSSSEDERMPLHFALGKAYEDIGAYEQAFRHLRDGNALKRRQVKYDEAGLFASWERLKTVFTADLIRQKSGLGDPSEVPVFIVGMPRSGTTLVEQVLASHPKVLGAGELEHMGRAGTKLERADSGGTPFPEVVPSMGEAELREVAAHYLEALPPAAAERITDKLPGNFRIVGLIHLALPKARIIHLNRDPVDTCLSCFSKLFAGELNFTYDLAELGRYYRAYEALMGIGVACCRTASCSTCNTRSWLRISAAGAPHRRILRARLGRPLSCLPRDGAAGENRQRDPGAPAALPKLGRPLAALRGPAAAVAGRAGRQALTFAVA